MKLDTISVDPRFRGPPLSGNGGYVCGLIARHLDGTSAVRLHSPPPLDKPMELHAEGDQVNLLDDDLLVARGQSAELWAEPPVVPSWEQARQGEHMFVGFHEHNFPDCFVCGPNRPEGDGLRIFTGPVPRTSVVAAPWIPGSDLADSEGNVDLPFVWAALDCPTAFALMPIPEGKALVLGELTARQEAPLRAGERYVVVAWPIRVEGRKRMAGSAIYTADGDRVALAQAIWIEVDKARFAEA